MQNLIATDVERAGRPKTREGMKARDTGSTGGTGLELVRQALEHGHSVTTLVRSPDRLGEFRDRISVTQGNLLNARNLHG